MNAANLPPLVFPEPLGPLHSCGDPETAVDYAVRAAPLVTEQYATMMQTAHDQAEARRVLAYEEGRRVVIRAAVQALIVAGGDDAREIMAEEAGIEPNAQLDEEVVRRVLDRVLASSFGSELNEHLDQLEYYSQECERAAEELNGYAGEVRDAIPDEGDLAASIWHALAGSPVIRVER